MEFRPCIDIHNGKVKQIVGSSLQIKTVRGIGYCLQEKQEK